MKIIKIICFFSIIIACSFLPVFKIQHVNITGNNKVVSSQILKTAGLDGVNPNFFYYFSKTYKNQIEEIPYIKSAKITKTFPNTINIEVKERNLSGYILYLQNMYIYIDDEGSVLDIEKNFTEKKPVIVGLSPSTVTVGSKLNLKNEEVLNDVVTFAQLFNKYDFNDLAMKINLSDIKNIHIFVNNIDIVFGNMENADEKLNVLRPALTGIPNYQKTAGYLYIDDITANPRFKMIN